MSHQLVRWSLAEFPDDTFVVIAGLGQDMVCYVDIPDVHRIWIGNIEPRLSRSEPVQRYNAVPDGFQLDREFDALRDALLYLRRQYVSTVKCTCGAPPTGDGVRCPRCLTLRLAGVKPQASHQQYLAHAARKEGT